MEKWELKPVKDRAKSFYGKAYVEKDELGNEYLYSYGTKLLRKDYEGRLTKYWDGWTTTTGRHIKEFAGITKKEYMQLHEE